MGEQAKPKRSPLIWIIEAFSVFTAVAFIVSAIGNSLAFAIAWKINYFMIAAPADVLMSGFIVFGILFISATISIIVAFISVMYGSIDVRKIPLNSMPNVTIAVLYATFDRVSKSRLRSILVIVCFFMLNASSVTLILQMWNGVFEYRDFTYWTGLKVAPAAQVDTDCRGAPILWMGSSSAIVGCERGVRVFHKLDGIVTEPLTVKRDPKEYAPKPTPPPIKVVVEMPLPKVVEPVKP